MASITVRGYINQPKSRESAKGTFTTFTLAERQKDKDGNYYKVYYDCVYFKGEQPADGCFATITGFFAPKEYTKKDGTKGQGLTVNVQEIVVAEPLPARGSVPTPTSAPEDPFALNPGA